MALCIASTAAIYSTVACGIGFWWKLACLLVLSVETVHGLRTIRRFRPFHLSRDAEGDYACVEGSDVRPLQEVRWQDYGLLLVLDGSLHGQRCRYFWWLPMLPPAQCRQLRLWIKRPKTKQAEMPSILVNPVL